MEVENGNSTEKYTLDLRDIFVADVLAWLGVQYIRAVCNIGDPWAARDCIYLF